VDLTEDMHSQIMRTPIAIEARETASLIGSDKVEGTPVYDAKGERIGSIERVMTDKKSGQVAYAVLSFGGFLGIGSDYYPIPWASLKYDTNLGGYRLDITEEQLKNGRCFRAVDSMSDEERKFRASDEETDHQIVHRRRFGKTHCATHQTLDPGPQLDVLALDGLRVLFANGVLLWVDVPLVRSPSIRVKPRDLKRLQQRLQLQKNGVLSAPEDVG
jgi:PRC-barrel domain